MGLNPKPPKRLISAKKSTAANQSLR